MYQQGGLCESNARQAGSIAEPRAFAFATATSWPSGPLSMAADLPGDQVQRRRQRQVRRRGEVQHHPSAGLRGLVDELHTSLRVGDEKPEVGLTRSLVVGDRRDRTRISVAI